MNKQQSLLTAASSIFTSHALMSKCISASVRAVAIQHNPDLESALHPDAPKLPERTPIDIHWQGFVYGSKRRL